MNHKNCLLCGVGGQGTILASKLIADAALLSGNMVRAAETIGMAQRGGSVVSHVRIGESVYSPMIPYHSADVIMAFEPAEAVRQLPYLKENGLVVVNNMPVKPVTATLTNSTYDGSEMIAFLKQEVKNLLIVDGNQACADCNYTKVLNVILLGATIKSGALQITMEQMEQAILQRVPDKFLSLNLKALSYGASLYK